MGLEPLYLAAANRSADCGAVVSRASACRLVAGRRRVARDDNTGVRRC